ncbi:MAG: amidohydrolase/deacetylase family metallohydrolase [Clostridiales bacterium]|nr:amidohydrolase/deacetylase family metallohydrolase [Clostridiales bacterium]
MAISGKLERYDLLIQGGRVIDPEQGIDQDHLDVAVQDGKIVRIERGIRADAGQVIDAAGLLVVPGLIDLHTHVYDAMTALSVPADPVALNTGVTTVVDCGTSGAATFAGFRKYCVEPARCRILAAVNIATIGLADMPECGYPPFVDSNKAASCIEANRDIAVAVKIRASRNALGDQGTIQTLWMAREAAEVAGVPVICHLGEPPPAHDEILEALRPGDILTHCFRQGPMHCPIDRNGRIKKTVEQARDRGVLFDVGHGRGSFSWRTARLMLQQDFWPDIISTDLHTGSIQPPIAISMPDVMSKMLHLGMDLRAVLAAATINPARSIGWQDRIGSLKAGQAADIAILSLEEGAFMLSDSHLNLETVARRFKAVWTILAGEPVPCRDR